MTQRTLQNDHSKKDDPANSKVTNDQLLPTQFIFSFQFFIKEEHGFQIFSFQSFNRSSSSFNFNTHLSRRRQSGE